MPELIDFLTPVGRLVMGDPFKGRTTDEDGKPLVVKTGPNSGQPRTDYFIGLAIPKTDPGWSAIHATIQSAAKQEYPEYFGADGSCALPTFSWKIIDGDSTQVNKRGVAPNTREGFAGNWILCMSSSFAPKCYSKGGETVLTDPSSIKRGYYVRAYGNTKGNRPSQTPGVYVNVSMVELIGYGPEIVTGPDAASVFGGSPVATLPAGASATPVAPATPIAQVTPAHDFVTGPPAPPVPPAPPAPPAPPVTERKYKVGDKEWTGAQLLAAGWTQEKLDALP